MCLGDIWYGSVLSLNDKVPLKHSIPVNMLLNPLCIFGVVLVPAALSVSVSGPATKWSASGLALLLIKGLTLTHFYLDLLCHCLCWLLDI